MRNSLASRIARLSLLLPDWKREQRESEIRARNGRVFSQEALQPGNKVRFNGSPTRYTIGPARNIIREQRKLTKAERKQAKRMKVADRGSKLPEFAS